MESTTHWDESLQPDFLLSVNDRMLHIREKLLEVAQTRAPIVLFGEKGLGKDVLAQTVHRWSPRAAGSFVRVNCTVIPRAQLQAELFGPAGDAASPFARAREGTLYLSGIEAFDAALASRLTAALDRLDHEPPDVAPRLVLSSEAVQREGAERRLAENVLGPGRGVVVTLPPLRDRPEDIGLMAQHLLQLHGPLYSSRIKQVRSSLIELFKQYPWPGNVRELERVIRRFLVLEDESVIRRELEEKIWVGNGSSEKEIEEFPPGMKLAEISKLAAQRAEARAIRRALEQTRWNKKAAALELGVSYKSLLNKVRDYRLDN